MPLYPSGGNPQAFDLLSRGVTQFGQEAKAFQRRAQNEASWLVNQAGGLISGSGRSAALRNVSRQRQQSRVNAASNALGSMAASRVANARAAAEASASAQRSAAAGQANTMGLIGSGIAGAGAIIGGIIA